MSRLTLALALSALALHAAPPLPLEAQALVQSGWTGAGTRWDEPQAVSYANRAVWRETQLWEAAVPHPDALADAAAWRAWVAPRTEALGLRAALLVHLEGLWISRHQYRGQVYPAAYEAWQTWLAALIRNVQAWIATSRKDTALYAPHRVDFAKIQADRNAAANRALLQDLQRRQAAKRAAAYLRAMKRDPMLPFILDNLRVSAQQAAER